MDARQVITTSGKLALYVMSSYLEDLSQEELFLRPGGKANHIAWQLGHLIVSENSILNTIKPGSVAELPKGFAEAHSGEATEVDDPSKFSKKEEYLELLNVQRNALVKLVGELSDDELQQPAPESIRSIVPTVADALLMMANHTLMHSGQIAVLRRTLGKPIII